MLSTTFGDARRVTGTCGHPGHVHPNRPLTISGYPDHSARHAIGIRAARRHCQRFRISGRAAAGIRGDAVARTSIFENRRWKFGQGSGKCTCRSAAIRLRYVAVPPSMEHAIMLAKNNTISDRTSPNRMVPLPLFRLCRGVCGSSQLALRGGKQAVEPRLEIGLEYFLQKAGVVRIVFAAGVH